MRLKTVLLKSLPWDRVTLVWLALIIATLASWILGVGHELPDEYAAVAIIVIAFSKVHFVGRYFMELREAPMPLIAVFEAWVCVVPCVLIGLYVFA
jgi:heme/copper-type cytochrome/quinol oxidase subunit 4